MATFWKFNNILSRLLSWLCCCSSDIGAIDSPFFAPWSVASSASGPSIQKLESLITLVWQRCVEEHPLLLPIGSNGKDCELSFLHANSCSSMCNQDINLKFALPDRGMSHGSNNVKFKGYGLLFPDNVRAKKGHPSTKIVCFTLQAGLPRRRTF